jgi:hypothetical protein
MSAPLGSTIDFVDKSLMNFLPEIVLKLCGIFQSASKIMPLEVKCK